MIQLKNILLLAASIFFYAWGEKWNVLLLIVSMLMNYALGLLADKESRNAKLRKPAVIAAAAIFIEQRAEHTICRFTIHDGMEEVEGDAVVPTGKRQQVEVCLTAHQQQRLPPVTEHPRQRVILEGRMLAAMLVFIGAEPDTKVRIALLRIGNGF